MADLELSEEDEAMLDGADGADGPAAQLCLRMVVALARFRGAPRLLRVGSAHVYGNLEVS